VSLLIRVALTLRIYTILLSAFSILHGNQLGYVTLLTVLLVILGALAASLREEEPQRKITRGAGAATASSYSHSRVVFPLDRLA